MADFPLVHITWSVADGDAREACDGFLRDVFAAQTVHEMTMTPETEPLGFDREETLFVVGDTMLIPIAPAGPGHRPESGIGRLLRDHDRPGMWLGIALGIASLDDARAWALERGCTPSVPPGAEEHCFLLDRDDALGITLEFLVSELPNEPRLKPDWNPAWWRDSHPLQIIGLQSVGASVPSLDVARAVFSGKFGWPEVSTRRLPPEGANCACFRIGDNVIEAMEAMDADSDLARHAEQIRGIYCLTFQVRSAAAAADYLRAKGFTLIGDTETRFAIDPDQAFGRRIYFTERALAGRPPFHSLLGHPAQL